MLMIKSAIKDILNSLKRARLNSRKHIEIGSETKCRFASINRYVRVGRYCNISGGEIDSYSYLGDNVEFPQTKIGKFCSIAAHAKLAAGNHPLKFISTSPYLYSNISWSFTNKKLFKGEFYYTDATKRYLCEIGNDVWIGTNALIVCGSRAIHIGDGAVIAAGAVVTKDIPPYAIVAGCPAKIIRFRFDDDKIKRLLELKWWDKDSSWIKRNVQKFCSIDKLDDF